MSKKKIGGKWDDITDEQIKDMIQESYEKGMKMLDSFGDGVNFSNYVNELKELLKFYFKLHNSAYSRNPDRELLIHSLEALHLFGSKKQAIAGQRAVDKHLKEAMEDNILYDKLTEEDQAQVLITIDALSGGKRRRKRKKRKRKKTRKKRKRKTKKRKRKSKKRRKK
jgi:hypothetical protein